MTDFSEKELLQKLEELKQYLSSHAQSGICIAYSGGVDSTLLLKTAVSVSRTPVLAVILETELHPHSDTEIAKKRAEAMGADCQILHIHEFQDPQLLQNPPNRCYLCKRLLFSSLKQLAQARGFHTILDGTNKDDEKEYRPGMKALEELSILSPLRELGITKAQVRALSALLRLPTASLPSTPCLATRLPYGAFLDRALLQRIHQGEQLLREKGFYNVRLRFHAPILRIETDCASFPQILQSREELLSALKKLGFSCITLDLEGFRSGSMDSISLPPSDTGKSGKAPSLPTPV